MSTAAPSQFCRRNTPNHTEILLKFQFQLGVTFPLIQVSAEEVAKAISSFPCGSSCSPDGLRPQHVKDMTGCSTAGGGQMLLQSLTSFINFIPSGNHSPNPLLFLWCYPHSIE